MSGPEDDPGASAFFRRSWSLYDAIVESNHMHHLELYAEVSKVFGKLSSGGNLRVLDLGCGNARCMAPILRSHPPAAYLGVDLSEAALGEAAGFLSGIDGIELKCSDLLEHAESDHGIWDVIFSGFAIHHLEAAEKARLFEALMRRMSGKGCFLMVDVVRDEADNREEHAASYTAMMRREWHGIPPEALEEGCAHVASYDHPASERELVDIARSAGFAVASELCRYDPHRAYLFSSGDFIAGEITDQNALDMPRRG
jgi:SAM-dependent methyltransferase